MNVFVHMPGSSALNLRQAFREPPHKAFTRHLHEIPARFHAHVHEMKNKRVLVLLSAITALCSAETGATELKNSTVRLRP